MGTAAWDCKAWILPLRRASSGSWGMSLSGNITSSSTGPTTRWGCPGCPELGWESQVFPTQWLAGLVPFLALLPPPRTIKVWRSPPVPCLSGKGQHIPGNVACPWCHPQLNLSRMFLCSTMGAWMWLCSSLKSSQPWGPGAGHVPPVNKPHSG